MKKIIIITLITVSLFAQEENQSQSIELPDFVITGKESISIRKAKKSSPDFIPLLSKDFFTPEYPNEEQATIRIPNADNQIVSIGNYKQTTNALLKISVGLETFPRGDFFYNDWNGNFSYDAHLFGHNQLEYVNHAGLSIAGGKLGGNYFIDQNSAVLPGLEFSLDGSYINESYNFYGSSSPDLNRITNNGQLELAVNYLSNSDINFGVLLDNKYYEQKDDVIDENVFGAGSFLKIKFSNFNFSLDAEYKNQSVNVPSQNFGNQYFVSGKATIGFMAYDLVNVKAGIYLSEREGNTFFSPVAYGSLKVNKNISIFGEFAPYTEFKTLQDFQAINRFYKFNDFVNLFIEHKSNLKFAAKFEYEKYFEISAGVGYLNSDNNYYFDDFPEQNGFFGINRTDTENSYLFVNMLFRKGPFGEFYGEAKLQKQTGPNNKRLPYSSTFLSELLYRYMWDGGFGIQLGLSYFNKSYSNLDNTQEIPEGLDVNSELYYELFKNFKLTLAFENLLDNDYYYYRNYIAKPIDLLVGFEFKW